ncbi:MAG: PHB depolymerase family esterase [Fulvimarina manganoxydans]|uniref:extracellular catalytic domain type 1 short-chain-length polyhydroxyalkanoate depolymerase n=1 Tax=Fulvimarina manganoxydans TaxID=937218 RepID=UPI002353AF30|nr:PHB depolymerase family esterase [Fulvimarina manganoxydans]MCK5930932.1 PHB depolymerase family esterase [Fulvimarina manganoxydans]
MTEFSKIDMGEVTRLTREGRLDEAMAMLKGSAVRGFAPSADGTIGSPLDLGREPGRHSRWAMPSGMPVSDSGNAPGSAYGTKDWFSSLNGRPRGFQEGPRLPTARGASANPAVPEGARFTDHCHSGTAGRRSYKLYVPSSYEEGRERHPLVVMLHGCTQSPDDFARGTRMNEIAEELGFLVVYPGQSQSANIQKCWNWFETKDQQRDTGEPSLIAGITREVMAGYSIDPKRVFIAGLSAGGAAAAVMGQRYPDLFAAVGVHSGLACGAARDMSSAFTAMRGGSPVRAGERIIPTIVFHGDGDTTVAPVNGDHVLEQAKAGTIATPVETRGVSKGGVAYTRTVQREADGRERLESWRIHGAGHAWSGGSAAGSYTLPSGPDASREMIRFFLALSA